MAFQQLYQNDARWKGNILGFGDSQTIEWFGCLLTSLTMVGNYYGGNETPASFNDKMKANQAFNGPWIKAFMVNKVFPNVKYQKYIKAQGIPAPLELIDQALAAGSLIVAQVDYSPQPGIQGHWIVLHKKVGDDYLIWDPAQQDGASDKLSVRYAHAGTPADAIQEAIILGEDDFPPAEPAATRSTTTTASKPAAPSRKPAARPAPSSAPLYLETTTIVNMRSGPGTNYSQVKQLARRAEMVALETNGAAKVGKQRQWLQVRTADGTEGYVAAWLVTKDDEPSLGVDKKADAKPAPPPPTSTSGTVTVKTTAQDVTLRSAPRVAGDTVIEYLKFGSTLKVAAADAAKIGQRGQWLQVTTIAGKSGYIAAWLAAQPK